MQRLQLLDASSGCHHKSFRDVFVNIPGLVNNARILKIISMYHWEINGTCLQPNINYKGTKTYILGDKGYPILPSLMVLHKQIDVRHIVLEALLNQQFFCGKSIVENVFGILKQMFMEL